MPDVGGNFEIPVNVPVKFEADYQALIGDLNSVSRQLTSSMSDAGREAMKKLESELRRGEGGALRAAETVFKKLAELASQSLGEDSPILDQITKTFEAAAGKIKGVGGADLGAGIGGRLKGQSGDDFGGVDESLRRMKANAAQLQDVFIHLQENLKDFVQMSEASFLKLGDIYQRFIGQETVGAQKKMQEDRIADRERERLHQNEMLNRRAGLAAEEEARFKRKQIIKDESKVKEAALKADNLALNAYFQQQVVKTKESLDRRQQLQRFFLDSTRSVFRGASSAVDNIWQAMYKTIGGIAKRAEDGLLSIVRRGSKDRENSYKSEAKARGDAMTQFSDKGNKGVVGALAGTSQMGGILRSLAMGAGAGFGAASTFKIGSEYMEQLNVVAALTNATTKEFNALDKAAMDLGKDITLPGISAAQAAEAMGYLARSGFSVTDSISAAKGVLSLARGANLDFGLSAEIVGKSLNVFKINAKDASQVADAFSGALSQAPQSINDIQAAVARGGGAFVNMTKNTDTARNNMEKFLATTSYLIKATGRSGEEVGTGMKRFFEVFQNPSKPAQAAIGQLSKAAGIAKGAGNIMFDASGKTRKYEEVVKLLQQGVKGLGTEQQKASVIGAIFGSEASGIALALADESFNVDAAHIKIRQLGDASKIAAARNQGLKGAFDALGSQFETFQIQVFKLVNKPLGNIVTRIAEVIDKVANGGGAFAILRQALLGAAAGIAGLLAIKGVIELFGYLKIAIGAVVSPMGLLVIAATAIGAAFAVAYKTSEPFRKFVGDVKLQALVLFENFQKKGIPAIVDFAKRMYQLGKDALEPVGRWFQDLWQRVRDFADNFGPVIAAAVALAKLAFSQLVEGFNGAQIDTVFGRIGAFAQKVVGFVQDAFQTIVGVFRWAGQNIKTAFDAGGILGVIIAPFLGIKNFFVGVFNDIDWGTVITTVLGGIRTVFAAIGRRIGLIVGSNEFRNTVLVAVGVIGGILGSAAVGLLEGLLDGLRKSELGRKVGEVLKNAINPIEIIKNIFGAFTLNGGAVAELLLTGGLIAGAVIAMKKLKEVFTAGMGGLKIGFQFATGNTGAALSGVDALKKKTLDAAKANGALQASIQTAFGDGITGKIVSNLAKFSSTTATVYTTVGVKAIDMADKVKKALSKLGGGQGGFIQATPLSGLANAIASGASAAMTAIGNAKTAISARFNTFKTEVKTLMQNGFGPALMDQMPGMLASGAAAGGGLAAMIVGDNPATKFAGLVSGITGVVTAINLAKQASQVFGSALAGIATGGVMAAFTIISFAVGVFAKRAADARKKAEETRSAIDGFKGTLSEIGSKFGYAGKQFEQEFAKKLLTSTDKVSVSIRENMKGAGLSAAQVGVDFSHGADGVSDAIRRLQEKVSGYKAEAAKVAAANPFGDDAGLLRREMSLERQIGATEKLIASYRNGGKALKEQMATDAAIARIEFEQTETAKKHGTELQKNADKTRSWRDAVDEVKNALVDALNAGKPKEFQKAMDDTATATRGFLESIKNSGTTINQVFSDSLTAGAVEGRQQFEGIETSIAGVVSSLSLQGQSQSEINKQLDVAKNRLIDSLGLQGAQKDEVSRIFTLYFEGYKELGPKALGFWKQNEKGLAGLSAAIQPLKEKLSKLINKDSVAQPLRDGLNAFINEPNNPKTIKTLIDLGIPEDKLAAFIANPSEATIRAILDSTVYEGQLPVVTAPVDKPVVATITNPTNPTGLGTVKKSTDKPVIAKLTNPDKPVGIGVLRAAIPKPVNPVLALLPGWFNGALTPAQKTVTPSVTQASITAINTAVATGVRKPIDLYVNNGEAFARSIATTAQRFGVRVNGPGTPPTAIGGIFRTAETRLIGEAGPEVVIPLTKPKRALDLYKQSGLGEVLAAGGMKPQAQGMPVRSSNVTVNQTFNVNGDTNLRKASRKAMASGYDLGRQLRGI